MGCLWCGKYSTQCKTMPSGPPEFIPPFNPVTGMKCSYGKNFQPAYRDLGWKNRDLGNWASLPSYMNTRKFYKGFRGKARSLKPGSYKEPGGGVLPYKGLMGTCGQPGYVFRDFCLKQGIEFIIFCLNQGIDLSIFVLNRINVLNRVSKIGILS